MHKPQSVRQPLLDVLDQPSSSRQEVWAQLRLLAECTDTLPTWACEELEVASGSSYAQAAAEWRDRH